MPTSLLRPLLLLVFAAAAAAQDGAAIFGANCAACHLVDRKHVGPSLVEIATLYRDKADAFVAWCEQPHQKRPGVMAMPSMAHVGEAGLRKVHAHVLEVTKGKEEVVVKGGDRFRASPSMRRRPQVQRTFMPDCGPAAIAVAVDDDWHYCFDAGACRLRYVWRGDFIDGWPVWRANGDALARVVGDVVLRELRSPLPAAEGARRRFLGYRLVDGLPTFRYRIGDLEVRERITVSDDGAALRRRFELRGAPDGLRLTLSPTEDLVYESGDGVIDGRVFTPAPDRAAAFTITMRRRDG